MSGVIYPINNKEYTAEDVEIFNCTRTNGVYSVLDFDYVLNGSVLTVDKGLAWIKNGDFKGKAIAFKEPVEIVLEPADADLDRYDVVAIRYDATKTEPELVIISGESSEEPVLPDVSRETYLYELFLYAILRKAGEKSPAFENIEDLRKNDTYCGIMRDSVTSMVAPVYETITEDVLNVGDKINFDAGKYEFLIATAHTTTAEANVILTKTMASGSLKPYFSGTGFYKSENGNVYNFYVQFSTNNNTHELILCEFSVPDVTTGIAEITKIVGATKSPEGYVKVDSLYNPKSKNAQSGEAVKSAIDEALYGVNDDIEKIPGDFPFDTIDLPFNEINNTYYFDGEGNIKEKQAINCTPIVKCPRYLGFRIEGEDTRIYLYIGTKHNGVFSLDESYIINTTSGGGINYLKDTDSRFIETDGEKYFYCALAVKDEENGKVTFVGGNTFPEGESNIVSTTPTFIGNDGSVYAEGEKYYSVVLPNGCYYAILNKGETYEGKSFNVSYEDENHVINVVKGASFGVIPENVGAALLRVPNENKINDLVIYTNKEVNGNASSGRGRLAHEKAVAISKDFSFVSQKPVFWNDTIHPMEVGRRFYGVPYSSRWVNSHYVGFEVTPETALNAFNDPYSVAYDGGFVRASFEADGKTPAKKYRDTSVSGYTEIIGNEDKPNEYGGTGYGLVCSAFTNLICGNPYPQTNRGYTFDSNYTIEDTIDVNSGEVLINKDLTHCAFVDEMYNDGYALFEAVDPCVTKTVHTSPSEIPTYMASKVRRNTLDKYGYSVVNRNTSGYDVIPVGEHDPRDKTNLLKQFDISKITIANGSVRPWRGNKSVYGSWDITPKADNRDFGGSKIGVTIHNDEITKFMLYTPSNSTPLEITIPEGAVYVDITDKVTKDGTYTLDAKDGSTPEQFRFYNHDTVQLTFDEEGKAVFKNSDGSVADDVEYIYVKVKGYGGEFGDDDSDGAMVIAKGNYYPDLALDTSRILDIRAAIISDITTDSTLTESWGKYSCATSPDVASEYKGSDFATKEYVDKALAEFEPPEQGGGSGVSEAQRQTLIAVVNAIGLFNVPNTQELLDNFNKAWDTVEPVPATSITLDKTEITFTAEEAQTILASVLPANTTDVVAWTSSNNSVATVKNGVVIPLNDGETVITAIAGNVSATCKVIVNMFGEVENPVFVLSGVINTNSTATSEPTANTNYPNSVTFSAIPVKSGTVLTCKTDINKPQDWVRLYIYDTNGQDCAQTWFADTTAGTVNVNKDGFIRVCIMRQNAHTFTTDNVIELSTTTNGEKTTYTLVDRR